MLLRAVLKRHREAPLRAAKRRDAVSVASNQPAIPTTPARLQLGKELQLQGTRFANTEARKPNGTTLARTIPNWFPQQTIRALTQVPAQIGGFNSRHLHIQSFTQTGKKLPVFFGAPLPLHDILLDIIYGTDRWSVPNDGVKVIQWT